MPTETEPNTAWKSAPAEGLQLRLHGARPRRQIMLRPVEGGQQAKPLVNLQHVRPLVEQCLRLCVYLNLIWSSRKSPSDGAPLLGEVCGELAGVAGGVA